MVAVLLERHQLRAGLLGNGLLPSLMHQAPQDLGTPHPNGAIRIADGQAGQLEQILGGDLRVLRHR